MSTTKIIMTKSNIFLRFSVPPINYDLLIRCVTVTVPVKLTSLKVACIAGWWVGEEKEEFGEKRRSGWGGGGGEN